MEQVAIRRATKLSPCRTSFEFQDRSQTIQNIMNQPFVISFDAMSPRQKEIIDNIMTVVGKI